MIDRRHLYVVYVEDVPGVLNRITSLFRRRSYNIDSLTVGRTLLVGVSRMTITLRADDTAARLFGANLRNLINVLEIHDMTDRPSVVRELALIKVRAAAAERAHVAQVAETFRARVVDLSAHSLVLESTGTDEKLSALVEALQPFGIVELVRTGATAMFRGCDETQEQTDGHDLLRQ